MSSKRSGVCQTLLWPTAESAWKRPAKSEICSISLIFIKGCQTPRKVPDHIGLQWWKCPIPLKPDSTPQKWLHFSLFFRPLHAWPYFLKNVRKLNLRLNCFMMTTLLMWTLFLRVIFTQEVVGSVPAGMVQQVSTASLSILEHWPELWEAEQLAVWRSSRDSPGVSGEIFNRLSQLSLRVS